MKAGRQAGATPKRGDPLPTLTTDVRGAQAAIDSLWDRQGVVVRASTGNLIALTDRQHLPRVEATLEGLEGRYAGRQIIAVLDDADEVAVQVSLVPQSGGRFVERLRLDAGEEQLRGAVLPLLQAAPMNYLWWALNRRPGGLLLDELLDMADKVICDSLSLDICPGEHYALADLGWARLLGWREALAQVFDRPDAARQIPALTHLRLYYAGANDLPAWLFAGFVADTLGWPDLSRAEVLAGACSRDNGDLCGLELYGEEAGVRFTLAADGAATIHMDAAWPGHEFRSSLHQRPLSLPGGLASLLAGPHHNPAFERSWQLVRAARQEHTGS